MRLEQIIADARMSATPYWQLRKAVGDVRLVGGLFVFLGLVPMLVVFFAVGRGDTMGARLLSIVNTLVLLGPGVWYFAAGTMMRRLSRPALRQAIWVARVQLVLVPLMLVISYYASTVGYQPHIFYMPAGLTAFFVPALIALMFTFRKIGWLMNQIEPEAHGFEALPVQVLPANQTPPTPSPTTSTDR